MTVRQTPPAGNPVSSGSSSSSTSSPPTEVPATDGRRKKRYAPKVRTGCITCKKRRVKCDETKPACIKCTSLGYRCDGYVPLKTWLFEPGSKNTKASTEKSDAVIKKEEEAKQLALTRVTKSPSEFTFTADEFRSMQFYLRRTGPMVAKYDMSRFQFWTVILPQAAHRYDSIKHALIATSLQDELITAPIPIGNIEQRIDYHYQQSLEKLLAKMKVSTEPPILNVLLNSMCMFYLSSLRGEAEIVQRHLDAARKIIDEWKAKGEPLPPSSLYIMNAIDEILLESRVYAQCTADLDVETERARFEGEYWESTPASTPFECQEDAQHALFACLMNCCKSTGQWSKALVRSNVVLDVWANDYRASFLPDKPADGDDDLTRVWGVAREVIRLVDAGSAIDPNERIDNVLEAMNKLPQEQLRSIQYQKPLTSVIGLLKQRAQKRQHRIEVAQLEQAMGKLSLVEVPYD